MAVFGDLLYTPRTEEMATKPLLLPKTPCSVEILTFSGHIRCNFDDNDNFLLLKILRIECVFYIENCRNGGGTATTVVNCHLPLNFFFAISRQIKYFGGIPYTAHGAQI